MTTIIAANPCWSIQMRKDTRGDVPIIAWIVDGDAARPHTPLPIVNKAIREGAEYTVTDPQGFTHLTK